MRKLFFILITLLVMSLQSCEFYILEEPYYDHVHGGHHTSSIPKTEICDNNIHIKVNVIHQPYSSNDKIEVEVLNESEYTIDYIELQLITYYGNYFYNSGYREIMVLEGPIEPLSCEYFSSLHHKYQSQYLHVHIQNYSIVTY